MEEKVVGIMGGMGPEATWDIFGRIIKSTSVKCDSEHLRIVIDNNPKIPDRTKAILGKGNSPIDVMISTAKNLEKSGVDFIIIPCMTAHYFIKDVQAAVNIPIINGLELVNRYIENNFKDISKIGLIATSGTVKSNLFQSYVKNKSIIVPQEQVQEEMVMDIIYGPKGIKAGNNSDEVVKRLEKTIEILIGQGAEAVIAGCTEIGLVLKNKKMSIPVIDPLNLLAEEAIRLAKEA